MASASRNTIHIARRLVENMPVVVVEGQHLYLDELASGIWIPWRLMGPTRKGRWGNDGACEEPDGDQERNGVTPTSAAGHVPSPIQASVVCAQVN